MLLSTLLFAVVNVLVKWLDHIPLHEVVLMRGLVTMAAAWVVLRQAGISWRGNSPRRLIQRSFFGSAAFTCYFLSLQHIPLATAVTVQYLAPVLTAIVAWFWLKERFPVVRWLLFLVAFAGVWMATGASVAAGNYWYLAGLASAILSAFAYVTIRTIGNSEHSLVVVFWFPVMAMGYAIPMSVVEWVMPAPEEWLWLGLVGLFSFGAQWALTRSLQLAQAQVAILMQYSGILYAIVLGMWLFGESYPAISLLGMGFVTVGVVAGLWYK